MANDPLNFGHDRSEVLGAVGDRDVHELFDCPAVGEVVVHGTDIVQSIRVRNELMIRPLFRQFFDAAMQEAHHGRLFDQTLTFQFEDHLQDPMGAWVLRTHIQQQLLGP
jgi:hypothetical protein